MTRTNALEALAISGWVRGLSMRDIEAALAEALGPDATVSKSTVSQICQAIGEQFDEFKRRDLSGVDLAYLYVDASHFHYHHAAGGGPGLIGALDRVFDTRPYRFDLVVARLRGPRIPRRRSESRNGNGSPRSQRR